MGSALLVFPMSVDKVAKRVWGTSDNSRVSLGHSFSVLSVANCRAHNNSDSGWSGNSGLFLYWELNVCSCTLDKRSQLIKFKVVESKNRKA